MDLVCVSSTSAARQRKTKIIFIFTWMCNCARFLCVFNSLISLQCDMRQYIYERSYAMNTISSRLNFSNENRSNCVTERIRQWPALDEHFFRIIKYVLFESNWCWPGFVRYLAPSRQPAPTDPESVHCCVCAEWPGCSYECARNAIHRNEKSFKCAEFRAPMIIILVFKFSYRKSDSFPLRCVVANMETAEAEPFHLSFVISSRNLAAWNKNAETYFERVVLLSPLHHFISWLDDWTFTFHTNGKFLRSNWRQYKT